MKAMNDTEVLVTCPYNRAHTIIRSRMQFHLTKCRQQSICNTDMVTCPFNSTHVVNRVELDVHQEICPNRIVFDSFVCSIGDATTPQGVVPVTSEIPIPESDENWDDNPVETSVLDVVKTNAKDKSVLLNLIGAPKSERKAHRIQERIRFQQVAGQEGRYQRGKSNTTINKKKETIERKEKIEPDFTYNKGKTILHGYRPLKKHESPDRITEKWSSQNIHSHVASEHRKEMEQFKKQLGDCPKTQETGTSLEQPDRTNHNGEQCLRPIGMQISWRTSRQPNAKLDNRILCLPVSGRGRPNKMLPNQIGNITNTN